jgi:hypothetical protein
MRNEEVVTSICCPEKAGTEAASKPHQRPFLTASQALSLISPHSVLQLLYPRALGLAAPGISHPPSPSPLLSPVHFPKLSSSFSSAGKSSQALRLGGSARLF